MLYLMFYLMPVISRHCVAHVSIVVRLSLKGYGVWTRVEQCDDHKCSGMKHGVVVMCAR